MRELLTLNDEIERGLRDQVVRPVLERGHGRCCIMIGRYGSAIESYVARLSVLGYLK